MKQNGKTIDQLRAELEQEQEKKLREFEMTSKLVDMLPQEFERFSVHCHGTSHSADYYLKVEGKAYPPDQYPTVAEVRALAAIFPPEPCKLYEGSYKSFFAVGQFERMLAKNKEKTERDYGKSEEDMCPWMITVAPADFSRSVTLEWFSVVDGQRVKVEVQFPLHACAWLGESHVEYKKRLGGRTCERNEFHLNNNNAYTLFDETDTPVAEMRQMICRWSTPENPGEFEIMWYPLDDRKPVTIEALCRVIEGKPHPELIEE